MKIDYSSPKFLIGIALGLMLTVIAYNYNKPPTPKPPIAGQIWCTEGIGNVEIRVKPEYEYEPAFSSDRVYYVKYVQPNLGLFADLDDWLNISHLGPCQENSNVR